MVWLMPLQTGNKRSEHRREKARRKWERKTDEMKRTREAPRECEGKGREREYVPNTGGTQSHCALMWTVHSSITVVSRWFPLYFMRAGDITLCQLATALSQLPTPSNHQPLNSQMQYIQCTQAKICSEVMVPSKERCVTESMLTELL